MNNQFNNRIDNISIIQDISMLLQALKSYPFFWNNSVVHSSSILTDKIFLQTHVTFCDYLVFHEFQLDVTCILLLLNTLNKRELQIYFFQFVYSLLKYWSNLMRQE